MSLTIFARFSRVREAAGELFDVNFFRLGRVIPDWGGGIQEACWRAPCQGMNNKSALRGRGGVGRKMGKRACCRGVPARAGIAPANPPASSCRTPTSARRSISMPKYANALLLSKSLGVPLRFGLTEHDSLVK